MQPTTPNRGCSRASRSARRIAAFAGLTLALGAFAAPAWADFQPGDLFVSRSVYDNNPANVQAGTTVLPPGCVSGCAVANSDGTYPFVFNNDLVDSSFGITSKVFLDELTPSGSPVSSLTA
jgi:hypothetical protein